MKTIPLVTVLFARADSVYKRLPGCDVFDEKRDARTWRGGSSVVAHPPCRLWGRLYKFAKPAPGEKELALYAVGSVRQFGGVLEHPSESKLWQASDLPLPGCGKDSFGGWTLEIEQFHWGHKAQKRTWLYIVGVDQSSIPVIPFRHGGPSHCIRPVSNGAQHLPVLSHAAREHTPPDLAVWLCDLARRVHFS